MDVDAPRDVTVLVGAHVREANALVDLLRAESRRVNAAGISVSLQRAAPARLVPALAAPSVEARRRILERIGARRWMVLAHMNALGPVARAIGDGVLYPDAEAGAAALGRLFPEDRVTLVLAIAPVTELLAINRRDVSRAARKLRWDQLYELSWADRVEILTTLLPKAKVRVLTPDAVADRGDAVAAEVLGVAPSDTDALVRRLLDETGREALKRTRAAGLVPDIRAMLPARAVPERLGVDQSLADLLLSRFEEDVARIAAIPGIEML